MPPKKRILTTVPTQAERPANKLVNHFKFVLDRSGSMGMIAPNAIKAFNDNVRAVRESAAQYGQESTIALVTFAHDVRVEWDGQPALRVAELNDIMYRTGGNTALFDAVGKAIELCESSPDAANPDASFVILVTTDGEENDSNNWREGGSYYARSRSYSLPSIVDKMKDVQLTDRYTLAFLVPPGKGRTFADRYGIPYGNVREWEATVRGTQEASYATERGTQSYFQDRSLGLKSKKDYYTTDLSSLSKSDLSMMNDLSANFKKVVVDGEAEIKQFIEEKGIPWVLGAGYYQVTKKELLRNGRNVLIREKGTKRIFGGQQARSLLGIPVGEVQITPGNHANYDIFFQSSSINRKLVRGTDLLWDKTHKAGVTAETWDSKAAKEAADLKKATELGLSPAQFAVLTPEEVEQRLLAVRATANAAKPFVAPGSTIKF